MRIIPFACLMFGTASATPDGVALFRQHCVMCHGEEGQGVPGVFPPLAKSDFLIHHRETAIRAVLEGLTGEITVNGRNYAGAMPPVILDDDSVAAVLRHVFTSWGNDVTPPATSEVRALRAKTKYPTFAALQLALTGQALPSPPQGWTLEVGAELDFSPVRLAADPEGAVLALQETTGDVWRWSPGDAAASRWISGADYLDRELGRPSALGMTVDRAGRLYLVVNQRDEREVPYFNRVTIFRSAPLDAGPAPAMTPWLHTSYPWGVGYFNHGVSHIAQGPDGFLYVNSGSRTDGGEPGEDERYAKIGEHELSACLWRLDPQSENPVIEIHARGLRNSFGFCWDEEGRLFATENGPDADPPEELNLIAADGHYGFPFAFSDWDTSPYSHAGPPPPGTRFTRPLRNLGPDAGAGTSSFDPHSCPTGIVRLDPTWPAPLGGSFVITRFGNLLAAPVDVGFDVLQVTLNKDSAGFRCRRLLGPLGRPIDLIALPGHRLVIAEFCRGTSHAAGVGSPGRLLVLRPAGAQ